MFEVLVPGLWNSRELMLRPVLPAAGRFVPVFAGCCDPIYCGGFG